MWKEIVHEYTEKGAYAQTDLHTKFLELKCPGGGDVMEGGEEIEASIEVEEVNKDWFSEIDEDDLPQISDWEIELAAPHSGSDTDSLMETAAEVTVGQKEGTIVELYDSGTMRHISPYCKQFKTLTSILSKLFAAANQQCFNATGIGELVIEVPNGMDVSKLTLTEVLYSPAVGYTLMVPASFETPVRKSLDKSPSLGMGSIALFIKPMTTAQTLQWRLLRSWNFTNAWGTLPHPLHIA
ncbi:uncharacterized protein EDB91DRAFT_1084594 [Suillus paluster]|uniref:uncharacterized protein n=1 Tax=Suillus paluster TaxID=48578 RepID=UPI001B8839D0|nr:uncharacterized protein EDB91DRAFT_1084594 [Suillus paluster]KAG1732846.1 hypothetical protein EDB91DRAFT_1084594 [Suillus paluster]